MSQLTDKMNAALANLESKLSAAGVTTDEVTTQIHTVVDPQITALNATISTITASEGDDATKIADLTAAVTEFTTAFAPATTPATPVADSAPVSPAPAPAPAADPAPVTLAPAPAPASPDAAPSTTPAA